jgi:nucleoid DNA-binding protein
METLLRKEFELHASKSKRSRRVGRESSDRFIFATKKEAEHVVNAVIASLETTLLNHLGTDGFTLKLKSFGKFAVRYRPGFAGRLGSRERPFRRR